MLVKDLLCLDWAGVGTGVETSRLNCTVRTGTFNCESSHTAGAEESEPSGHLKEGSALSFYLFRWQHVDGQIFIQ